MSIFKRCFSTIKNINKYSGRINKKLTIKNLLELKKINKNYRKQFLNEDLKSRLSEKIIEIENFPLASMMPSIKSK